MQKDSEMRIVLRIKDKNISRIFHIERILQTTANFSNAILLHRKNVANVSATTRTTMLCYLARSKIVAEIFQRQFSGLSRIYYSTISEKQIKTAVIVHCRHEHICSII